jgi:hypothetical protein
VPPKTPAFSARNFTPAGPAEKNLPLPPAAFSVMARLRFRTQGDGRRRKGTGVGAFLRGVFRGGGVVLVRERVMKQVMMGLVVLAAAVGVGWLMWGQNNRDQGSGDRVQETENGGPVESIPAKTPNPTATPDPQRPPPAPVDKPDAAVSPERRPPNSEPLSLPGVERPEEPQKQSPLIEAVIRPESGWNKADVQALCLNLKKLDPDKLTQAEKDALRWLLFEQTAHETVRNDAANVLLKAKDAKLPGALCAMLRDKAQTPTWRNYCVQHLAVGYEQGAGQKEVLEEMFRAATADEAPEVREVCLYQLGRLAEARQWKEKDPALHNRTAETTKRFLDERKTPADWVAGVRAAGQLGLSGETVRVSQWLADEQTPLGVRQTIAAELGRIGVGSDDAARAQAKTALAAVLKHHNKLLREQAEKALKKFE